MTTGPWPALAALTDPQRRALFDFVRGRRHPVTREEAAAAHGISRNLAAFHLDKLVDVGLLQARYEAPADQPRGRGRTPKVYLAAAEDVAVSVPPRRYQLIADILADAVAEPGVDARAAALRLATERGERLGRELGPARSTGAAVQALAELGFEPQPEGERIVLVNCPFHTLAQRHPELVCALNHAFLAGLVARRGHDLRAELVPRPGACCVQLRRSGRSEDEPGVR